MIDTLAFTGTREGMTERQKAALALRVAGLAPRVFLHGGAEGADTEAHDTILEYVTSAAAVIEVYPCNTWRRDVWRDSYRRQLVFEAGRDFIVHPIMEPLARNHVMVDRCNHLLATPAQPEEQHRSGTWATIRYARSKCKPVTLILPDGKVVT